MTYLLVYVNLFDEILKKKIVGIVCWPNQNGMVEGWKDILFHLPEIHCHL